MFIEEIAHITCSCGKKIQILNVDKDDWNEVKTATSYEKHLIECEGEIPSTP